MGLSGMLATASLFYILLIIPKAANTSKLIVKIIMAYKMHSGRRHLMFRRK
jgi:hypothetical protein